MPMNLYNDDILLKDVIKQEITQLCVIQYIYNKVIQVLQLAEHNTEVTEIVHCYQYYII